MPLRYKVNVNTLEQTPTEKLELNEIGVCELELDRPVAFDPYIENRDTGGFILIDRITNNTVGAGMIRAALKRSTKVDWQALEVNKQAHAALKGQRSAIIWFTGIRGQVSYRLPASSKETLCRRPAHVPARKQHRPPRLKQRPGLQRRWPR